MKRNHRAHAKIGWNGKSHVSTFFGIFRFYSAWGWSSLPRSYLSSEYLTSDIEACLLSAALHSESSNQDFDLAIEDSALIELNKDDEKLEEIPSKKVR